MGRIFTFSDLPLELKFVIFEQLDRPTLHSTVQVNLLWFHLSASLLWYQPSFWRIANLASQVSAPIRQYYANKIRTLEIRDLNTCSAFEQHSFPQLRSLLLLSTSRLTTRVQLRPYLQPKLRVVSLGGCELSVHSLNLLASCCPYLHTVRFHGSLGDVSNVDLAEFIRSLPCLRKLMLGDGFSVSATNQILSVTADTLAPQIEWLYVTGFTEFLDPGVFRTFIANCRSLELLGVRNDPRRGRTQLLTGSILAHLMDKNPLMLLEGDLLTPHLLEEASWLSSSKHLLGKLQYLRPFGCSLDLVYTLRYVSDRLISIEFWVNDIATELFRSIGRQMSLKRVVMSFPQHTELFFSTSVSTLSSLKLLERLEIRTQRTHVRPAALHELDDDAFKSFISNFPRLRTLVFDIDCPLLSAASIETLSRACPSLERCVLLYSHDLSTWVPLQSASGLLFPNLTSLNFGRVVDFAPASRLNHANQISPDTSQGQDDSRSTASTPIDLKAEIYAKMLLKVAPGLGRFGIGAATESALALITALHAERPCKRLGEGNVAERTITTRIGTFIYERFGNRL